MKKQNEGKILQIPINNACRPVKVTTEEVIKRKDQREGVQKKKSYDRGKGVSVSKERKQIYYQVLFLHQNWKEKGKEY